MKEIILWAAGLLTTLIGFGAKWIADYLWLKSPRLLLKAKPVKGYLDKINDELVLKFDCSIDIVNYSKNEAYGLEICDIKPHNSLYRVILVTQFQKPITDQEAGNIKFSCIKKLDDTRLKKPLTIKNDELKFYETFSITCTFYNQLGKKHKHSFQTEFKEIAEEKFFTF